MILKMARSNTGNNRNPANNESVTVIRNQLMLKNMWE